MYCRTLMIPAKYHDRWFDLSYATMIHVRISITIKRPHWYCSLSMWRTHQFCFSTRSIMWNERILTHFHFISACGCKSMRYQIPRYQSPLGWWPGHSLSYVSCFEYVCQGDICCALGMNKRIEIFQTTILKMVTHFNVHWCFRWTAVWCF